MRISDKIKKQGFVTTCEIDSPKGIGIEEFLDKVDMVKSYVDAITAGDNQRAVMRAAPWLSVIFSKSGMWNLLWSFLPSTATVLLCSRTC